MTGTRVSKQGCVFVLLFTCVVSSDLYGDQGGFVSSYGYGQPLATGYVRTKVVNMEKKTGTEGGDVVNYQVAPPPKVSSYSGGYSTRFHSSYGTSTPKQYSSSFVYNQPGTSTPIHQGYAHSKVVTVEKTLGDTNPVDYQVAPPPKVSSYSGGYSTTFHSSYGTSTPKKYSSSVTHSYPGTYVSSVPHRTYAHDPKTYGGSAFVSTSPFEARAGYYTPSVTRPVLSSVQHNVGSFVADTLKSTYGDSVLKL
ncbi:uncharacterized protein LOC143254468 isoform X1 [Tachypleus tridentatus]|uniref:uncharacterized protein LOC143254468 isoform X1 n=1 Tax=Tachypleus tridentatus TaxID=6853 RepID=UPI003FD15037